MHVMRRVPSGTQMTMYDDDDDDGMPFLFVACAQPTHTVHAQMDVEQL